MQKVSMLLLGVSLLAGGAISGEAKTPKGGFFGVNHAVKDVERRFRGIVGKEPRCPMSKMEMMAWKAVAYAKSMKQEAKAKVAMGKAQCCHADMLLFMGGQASFDRSMAERKEAEKMIMEGMEECHKAHMMCMQAHQEVVEARMKHMRMKK